MNHHPPPYFKPQPTRGALSWSYVVKSMPVRLRFAIPVKSVCTILSPRNKKDIFQSCIPISLNYEFLLGGGGVWQKILQFFLSKTFHISYSDVSWRMQYIQYVFKQSPATYHISAIQLAVIVSTAHVILLISKTILFVC